jgi:hypothetical protein
MRPKLSLQLYTACGFARDDFAETPISHAKVGDPKLGRKYITVFFVILKVVGTLGAPMKKDPKNISQNICQQRI